MFTRNESNIIHISSFAGFYGATYMKGFRDKFKIDNDILVKLISGIEARVHSAHPAEAARIVEEIKVASKDTTHM